MKRNILLTIAALFAFVIGLHAQATVEGKIVDEGSGEPIAFANVALMQDGQLLTGTQSDFDGNYTISGVDPGTYDIKVSFTGYPEQLITGVSLSTGKTVRVDFKMTQGVEIETVKIIEYKKPLIEQDNTSSGGTLTSDDIKNLPTRSINTLASLTAGVASSDGGGLNVRGSRSSATDYYLDGIRISGTLPPESEIEQLTVLVGGIPAAYGDNSGGLVSLTSKGPSQVFRGGVEVETSEFLDAFGYNLINANLSGPILKKNNRSVIGFRLAGRYNYLKDDVRSPKGVFRASESSIAALEQNPLFVLQNGQNYTFYESTSNEYLASEGGNIEELKSTPNTESKTLNLMGRLDFRFTPNIDLSLTANYIDRDNRFTPSRAWSMFNWTNNPHSLSNTYRGTVRFRHKLGRAATDPTAEKTTPSSLRNAYYSITGSVQRREGGTEDLRHGENYFNYGHVGTFASVEAPIFQVNPMGEFEHTGFRDSLVNYVPGNTNPVWTRLNDQFLETRENSWRDFSQVQQFEAFNGGRNTRNGYGLYSNPGAVYNTASKFQADRYTADVKVGFDFYPGSSDKGRHSIEIGFLYEQRVSRNWDLSPYGLWRVARLLQNGAFDGVDTTQVIGTRVAPNGTIIDIYKQNITSEAFNPGFYRDSRISLGLDSNEYLYVDALDPGSMNLDWFSATELVEQNLLQNTYGYDKLGDVQTGNVSFDDFFTSRKNGERTFAVAPFRPNFLAFYIQDKFSFKDIIFRLGLRAERYDANTKVLKDPFSLYEIITAEEFYDGNPERPAGVGDDFKVYTTTSDSRNVVAFREDEQWYDPNGNELNNLSDLLGRAPILNPHYKESDAAKRSIKSDEFDVNSSFEDFKPQLTWAPRLSFSFPISEASNFYANYDILYQRPTTGVYASPFDYYFFEEKAANNGSAEGFNSNPNLKPQQTTAYELGFNQKISNSSAIKISAFYKEERNLIQLRQLQYVSSNIGDYVHFDNLDFSTVKGFSFQYDLRRTGNVSLLVNYTLQFADGTGSDATSQFGLINSGINVREVNALSFDERHRFNIMLDYRYASGKQYNGPKVFGADIFANAGINVQSSLVSGQPYTQRQRAIQFGGSGYKGGINEARLPWQTNVDLKIDKNFRLGGQEGKRSYGLNVFFRVQNLFDTENVTGVYSSTGSPDNDGFLASENGFSAISSTVNSRRAFDTSPNEYEDQYYTRMVNGNFFTLPRRMYIGASFSF